MPRESFFKREIFYFFRMNFVIKRLFLLGIVFCFLFILVLCCGETFVPPWHLYEFAFGSEYTSVVFWNFRWPLALGATVGGIGLSVSGLVMQSVFRNPLAGPFVLGVSSGASLGVALVGVAGFAISSLSILPAALAGAFLSIFIVFSCSRFIVGRTGILVVGLMVGYLADALVSLILYFGEANALRGFITWGMGSFSRVTRENLVCFSLVVIIGLVPCFLSSRYLNLAPFGEQFVKDHGLSVKLYRWVNLLSASFLAAVVTAFCGPIAFLGLAVPHLAYGLFRSTDHRILLPGSALIGASIALFASLFPHLPLQALMSVIGAPVILWILLSSKGKGHG